MAFRFILIILLAGLLGFAIGSAIGPPLCWALSFIVGLGLGWFASPWVFND
jgi:hypothetical protein